METLLGITLFGSIFWGIAVLVLLIILFFYADLIKEGFAATFVFIVAGVLFYFWGKDTWKLFVSLLTFMNISLYLGTGLIYAFVRIFFHGRNEMMAVNKHRLQGNDYYEHSIDRDIKEDVFRWWFLWPISMINWFIKDLIRDIYNWCYDKLSRLFNFVLDLGIKSVHEVPKKEKKK
jgi:hypothetical protein